MKKKEETSEQMEVCEQRRKSRMLGVIDGGLGSTLPGLGGSPSSAVPYMCRLGPLTQEEQDVSNSETERNWGTGGVEAVLRL